MAFLSANRNFKDVARRHVFTVAPKRHLLLLPGHDLKDVHLAIKLGIISQDSKCVFIEQDKRVFDKIQRDIHDHWQYTAPQLHNCPLHRVKLREPLDFAFVDLCGNLLAKDALWIQQELAKNLLPGADVAFTFTAHTRNNLFIKQCIQVVEWQYPDFVKCLEGSPDIIKLEEIAGLKICPLLATYIVLVKHVFFPKYAFSFDIHGYRDKGSGYHMVVLRLNNLRKDVSNRSTLDAQLGVPRVQLICFPNNAGVYLMATTKTTKGTKATTKTTENSKSIAEAIVSAKTSSQKAAANRRLSSLQKRRKSEGADPKMVKAGVQSWVTRLRSKSK